jgi:hypothetical protein
MWPNTWCYQIFFSQRHQIYGRVDQRPVSTQIGNKTRVLPLYWRRRLEHVSGRMRSEASRENWSQTPCLVASLSPAEWSVHSRYTCGKGWLIDWLIICCFTSRSRIFHLYGRWRASKFRPMLSAQGLWAGRDLYRATPAVTRDLGFSGLIRRTAPFSRLLRHTRGCGGSILTRILTTVNDSLYTEKGKEHILNLALLIE